MGSEYTGTQKAQRFFEEQMKDYSERLSEAEAKLAEFKKKNMGLVPGEEGDYFQRLTNEAQPRSTASKLSSRSRSAGARSCSASCAAKRRSCPRRATRGTRGPTRRRLRRHGVAHRRKRRRGSTNCCCASPTNIRTCSPRAKRSSSSRRASRKRSQRCDAAMRARPPRGAASNPVFQNIQLQAQPDRRRDRRAARAACRAPAHRRRSCAALADTAPEVEAEFAAPDSRLRRHPGAVQDACSSASSARAFRRRRGNRRHPLRHRRPADGGTQADLPEPHHAARGGVVRWPRRSASASPGSCTCCARCSRARARSPSSPVFRCSAR